MKSFNSIRKLLNFYGCDLSERELSYSMLGKTHKYIIYYGKDNIRAGRIYYQPRYAYCDLEIREPLNIEIQCQYVDCLYDTLERLLKIGINGKKIDNWDKRGRLNGRKSFRTIK